MPENSECIKQTRMDNDHMQLKSFNKKNIFYKHSLIDLEGAMLFGKTCFPSTQV